MCEVEFAQKFIAGMLYATGSKMSDMSVGELQSACEYVFCEFGPVEFSEPHDRIGAVTVRCISQCSE